MQDPLVLLLTVLVVLLTVVIVAFLIALVFLLLTLKKTLIKLQNAIENVEDTAIRSLAPLLSLKSIVTDFGGFISAIGSVTSLFSSKKKTRVLKDRND